MSDEKAVAQGSESNDQQEARKGTVDWEDPSVPVGNSPCLPRWPVAISAVLWASWIVFLVFVLSSANQTHFH